jgi:hypothetical protein
LPSRPEAPVPKLTAPCDVELISAHMAASIGQQKAMSVVSTAVKELGLPGTGQLSPEDADRLFDRLQNEPGLVGLAAKVSRQMVRMGVAPLKPAF